MSNGEAADALGIPQGSRVWVGYTRKINLGNYESMDLSVGMSRDVEQGEDRKTAVLDTYEELRDVYSKLLKVALQDAKKSS